MGLLKRVILFIPYMMTSIIPPPINRVANECIGLVGDIFL